MNGITENLVTFYGVSETFPNGSKAFKQLQLQNILKIPLHNPDIEQIISISDKIEILNTYVMAAVAGRSYEGQTLTGKKLIVEGKVHQKLEYAADLTEQPIRAVNFVKPFSTFIVMGDEIDCFQEFHVTGYIEDISSKQIDKRTIYKNVILLLVANPVRNI